MNVDCIMMSMKSVINLTAITIKKIAMTMRKLNTGLILLAIIVTGCNLDTIAGNNSKKSALLYASYGQPIIADHTIVADYDKIPAQYMAEVKKMVVAFPGESHSYAYRRGMELLEGLDPDYACNVSTGEAYTDQYVRVNYSGCGEAEWFTWYAYDGHNGASRDVIKNMIAEYESHGHPIHAMGFGWCWDMTRDGYTATADPVYGCRWAGSSAGGPDGDTDWGLNGDDYGITLNRVSMDTYLWATDDYNTFCAVNGYVTRAVFTTGPADLWGEEGYQGHLKHEYIRNYVKANKTRILFDYADILSYDNSGNQNTTSWNGHTFPTIASDNMLDLNGLYAEDGDHIGERGAVRLAKAQWWMLARIAGWNGN